MSIISCNQINIEAGTKTLIKEGFFSIGQREKVGFIGRNGSGKSTLLEIIWRLYNKENLPEKINLKGSINLAPEIKIAYLPQEVKFRFEGTVEEYLDYCGGEYIQIIKRYNELKEKQNLTQEETEEIQELTDKMTQFDLWGYLGRREKILSRLGLGKEFLQRQLSQISGGEATRVALAGVLLSDANFWILDEPTNNLDLEGINLLLEEIQKFRGAVLIVTHDRRILNQIGKIVEIDEETKAIKIWGGNYEFYKEKREEEFEARVRKYEEQERKRKQLEESIEELKKQAQRFEKMSKDAFYRAKGAKLAKQAKARIERIERELTKLTEPQPPERPEFPLPIIEEQKGTMINMKNIDFAFDNRTIFENFNLVIEGGDRIWVKGPNGSGKTTLFKLIISEVKSRSGEIFLKSKIKIGYLEQTPIIKDKNQKIKDYLRERYNLKEEEIMKTLRMIKALDEANLKIGDLSLGEIRRIQLAGILISNPDVLILDEPTNHLDIYTIEELEKALQNYRETIIFSTHDEYFAQNIGYNKEISLGKVI